MDRAAAPGSSSASPRPPGRPARTPRLLLAGLLLAAPPAARGRGVDVGVPELALRFDNTLRYNLAVRTDPVDAELGANPAFTGGEYSFERGAFPTNRLDLLSELDLSWRERWGVRVSGAFWYDHAYRSGKASRSPALVAAGVPGSYVGDDLSDATRERYHGPWGELLDAFAFAKVDAAGVPITVKAGRHALTWGESLMLPGATHGVSYAQAPLDLAKANATPGVEAKELFRPLAAVSAQAQLTPALSLAAQVFLEWEPFLYPEGGTFLGAADATFEGPDGAYRDENGPAPPDPVFLRNGGARAPREAGDLGVALRWAPERLGGTFGLYYRRYTDKAAAVLLTDNPGGEGPLSPELPSPFQYVRYFAESIDLVGVSLARQILGASVAAEVSWRHDTPLLAPSFGFAVAPRPDLAPVLFPGGAPRLVGNSYQARGDTLHAVLNAVGVVSGGRLFGSASWAVELTGSRWLEVRENRDMFFGEGYGVCRDDPDLAAAGLARTRDDGCATRGHLAVAAGLTPTWFRVASGVDLLVPLTASWTVWGNSPVTLGGNEDSGTVGAGVALDVRNRYRLDLRYVDYFGARRVDRGVVTSANGQFALLHSRANVAFTAKTTF